MAPQRVIGVDLGGTKILAGVVDRNGSMERRRELPTPLDSQDELLDGLAGAVEDVLSDDVAAIGFGIPSTIDQRSGKAVTSVNIPLADLDLRAWMRERFGLSVGIDNDANAATLAEWAHGAGRGTRHMVMLTLGTGVGGGLILDGKPYRGAIGVLRRGWVQAVLDQDRDRFADHRLDRRRMQHLRAEVRQLHRLFVRDLRQDERR